MTPGKHIVPNEVELKCFFIFWLNTIRKIHIIKFTGEKAFFVTRVFKYVSEKYFVTIPELNISAISSIPRVENIGLRIVFCTNESNIAFCEMKIIYSSNTL